MWISDISGKLIYKISLKINKSINSGKSTAKQIFVHESLYLKNIN